MCDFQDVYESMIKLYYNNPDDDDNKEWVLNSYKEVYERLLVLEPSKDKKLFTISVTKEPDDEDDDGEVFEGFWDVCGRYENDTTCYSPSLSTWSEWLGFTVIAEEVNDIGIYNYIAHVLWDMTFYGYTEDDLKEVKDSLLDITKDIEESIANNDMSKFVSWDQIQKELDENIN